MITGVEIPDALIALERAAEEARARMAGLDGAEYDAQWKAWRAASAAAQAAITDHAKATRANRYDVEQAVKHTVRHQAEDPAE
ncbi:hypothetical protein AB0F46_18685 [Streptomyces sp. NPDC026665]|uniref:hypothetical protein n=1 Tax=Streptomyces sp. NPDC026665 TaxID=3154798 RepID=UPI0033E07707